VIKPQLPSIDHGVISLVWAVLLGGYVWVGLLAIGIQGAVAFIFGLLTAFAVFLLVRIFGEHELKQR
jgi:hypothetical protein